MDMIRRDGQRVGDRMMGSGILVETSQIDVDCDSLSCG